MAVVGQLLVELSANVARLRTDMERASGLVESHTQRIAKAASFATGALGAVGAGLSVGALVSAFRATVDSMDALNDASDRTGASVEELSSLVNTLSPYGATLDQISEATGRLAKSMAGADDETKGAGAAFAALGVQTRDSSGNLRSTVDVMQEVARSLAQYEDGTNKTVLAQQLFGKSGAALLPMLKDLAEAKRADATVSTEQAAAAERFNVQLGQLARALEGVKVEMTGPILTAAAEIIERFNAAGNSAENFYNKLRLAFQPNKELARLENAVVSLEAELSGLQKLKVLPEFEADRIAQAATVTERLAKARKALNDAAPVRALMDPAAAMGEMNGAPLLQQKRQAPVVPDGGAAKAARDAIDAYKEFDAFIRQTDIDYTLRQQADAAKELATQLERAAAAALSRIAANDRAEQDADEGIRRDVEAIKDAIDPTRALYRELERVRELTSAGLLPTDAGNARMMQVYGQIDQILVNIPERAAEAKDAMQGMLAPIESAFESAIIRGEKLSDVLSSLAQDFARLMLRQQITGPLSDFLSGGLDPAKQSGTIFGQILSGITGSGGGPELLNKSAGAMAPSAATKSAGSIVVNQTITYGSGGGRAEAFAFAQTVKADTIRAIKESEARGA
jgi:hypothetical protein